MAFKRNRDAFEADFQKQESPFVFFGTPLPPLDPEARDDGSYVPVWKQEVRDDKGRKRLHGAFTGGFSAGYFNTVGSKDGWTPSAFVSSRSSKTAQKDASAQEQRIEDFMDDEDLADAEESRNIQTQGQFAAIGGTAEDSQHRDTMSNLLRPSGDTMGIKLLQRMGWKQGQGIGPKVRRNARLQDTSGIVNDDDTHLFAPEDGRMIAFNYKTDTKGLGFASESLTGVSTDRRNTDPWQEDDDDDPIARPAVRKQLTVNKKKTVARKGGIGMGILNDTGSDDDDPFSIGPRISYNRTLGAQTTDGNEVIKPTAKPSLQNRPVFVGGKRRPLLKSQIEPTDLRKCHDGKLPLDGFVLAMEKMHLTTTVYEPPQVPEGWIPRQKASVSAEKSTTDKQWQSSSDAAKTSTLDPKQRASVLGEASLPGKSVFDFLTPEARARIVAATGRTDLPQAGGEALPGSSSVTETNKPKSMWHLVPDLDRDTASAALARSISGWTPYTEDEGKRQRYRTFIEVRAGVRDFLPERGEGMSTDDWVKEMKEFAHAAQVFKPVSGLMASRFTSSRKTFEGGSDVSSLSDGDSAASLLSRPIVKPEDPAEAAAKMGMYGPLTRTVLTFYPTRLVCKRFNVKPPENVQIDPGAAFEGDGRGSGAPTTKVKDVVSRVTLDRLLQDAAAQRRSNTQQDSGLVVENTVAAMEAALAQLRSGVDPTKIDAERNEALEASRPGDDVFKAIFGDDSDDD